MEEDTHIIDPEGEVVIIVRNPNALSRSGRMKVPKLKTLRVLPAEESDEVPTSARRILTIRHDTDSSDEESANGSVEEEADVRIQVSAKHLMLASPVFKKALTGKWKEGSTFVGTGSVEITTESWDVEAFLILPQILHCQHHKLPKRVSLELAAKIAVLADYYECNDLVAFIRDAWITCLREELPETYSRNLVLWLWIAWYFNIPTKFKKATSIAMSESKNEIDALGLPIPARIIYEMNRKKTTGYMQGHPSPSARTRSLHDRI